MVPRGTPVINALMKQQRAITNLLCALGRAQPGHRGLNVEGAGAGKALLFGFHGQDGPLESPGQILTKFGQNKVCILGEVHE